MVLTVGVLGAGQLGRMLALAGYPLGIRCVFVDPSPDSTAGEIAPLIVADYDDPGIAERLGDVDLVTYEFESVPEAAALKLMESGKTVLPHPRALRVAQDRWLEKMCFREVGIPTARFAKIDGPPDWEAAVAEVGLPCVFKTRRHGYDGRGQQVVERPEQCAAAFSELGKVPLIAEQFVSFARELSIIAVRGTQGEPRFYPVCENVHSAGMLQQSLCPANGSSEKLQEQAERHARALLAHLDYTGVMALEMFEVGGELYGNEIAPRVHNSGHLTIEAALTSQFENHLRAIIGLPLGCTEVPTFAAMLNIVGSLPDSARVLAVEDAHLHLYGKSPRAGRKLGHVTVRAKTRAELSKKLIELKTLVTADS
jgi:5-(carboxyamino)imidazole ribonucleotide synthase